MSLTPLETTKPIFAAEGFAKRFGDKEVLRAAAVRAWSGRVTLLLGRNGSGKSTLLRCALGLLTAEMGTVTWRGRAMLRPKLARLAREGLFFVPDRGLAVPRQRVHAHLGALRGAFPAAYRLADHDPLDIESFVGARVRQLSGGERRRIELSLGLLRNPRCLIADEPLTGLAPADQRRAVEALRDAARRGAAVIITGHEVEQLMDVGDEVVWVVAGGTRVLGSPEQAWSHPEFRRQYLGRRSLADLETLPAPDTPSPRVRDSGRAGLAPRRQAWPGRARRIWWPIVRAAAGIWFAVRILAAVFGAAVAQLPLSAEDPPAASVAVFSIPLVGVCVFLAWVDQRRRGGGLWLATLGTGPRAALLAWTATCLLLEFAAAALRSAW